MLKRHRLDLITDALRRDGRVLASELAAQLDISDDTVRRDLAELAEMGVLQRVHGGALPTSPAPPAFVDRERQAPEAKRAIARAAAALFRDGQAIFLDGGTTARLVARQIPAERRLTVITHSPTTAEVLMEHPGVELMLIGGRVLKPSRVAVGAATVDAIRSIRADLYVMGVNGLHHELGISTHDAEEAHVKRAMIESAAETIALVSSEKLGTASRWVVAPTTEITQLITERTDNDEVIAAFERLGITVVRA